METQEPEEASQGNSNEVSALTTRICSNPECQVRDDEGSKIPQLLDAEHFAPSKKYAKGYKTICRDCDRRRAREWARNNKARANANRTEWARNNQEYWNEYQRIRLQERAKEIQELETLLTTATEEEAIAFLRQLRSLQQQQRKEEQEPKDTTDN